MTRNDNIHRKEGTELSGQKFSFYDAADGNLDLLFTTKLQEEAQANKEAMRVMNRNIRSSFQKIGIVHYDAFDGMGGKMSFAMAVLDYTNSGFVLNCMHSREGCFLYVKDIDAGTTDTPLGAEEKEALERALGYIGD